MPPLCLTLGIAVLPTIPPPGDGQEEAGGLSGLAPNTWVLLHREDDSGGKAFSRAVFAPSTGRVHLWGTGGRQPAGIPPRRRNVSTA